MENKWIVSTKEFADLCARTTRTITDYSKKIKGFNRASHGKWDLQTCLPALLDFAFDNARDDDGKEYDLRQEQARLSAIKADREEYQHEIDKKQYIHIDDVTQYALGRDVAIAEQIDAIPSRYTPNIVQALTKQDIEIEPAVIYEILEQIKNEVREDVANGLAAIISDTERDTDSQTPT